MACIVCSIIMVECDLHHTIFNIAGSPYSTKGETLGEG